MPKGAVYVGRGSLFGNPFRIGRGGTFWGETDRVKGWWVESPSEVWMKATREEAHYVAAELYRAWLLHPAQRQLLAKVPVGLAGHDLACWCPLDQPCHADVLLELAN